MSISETQSQRHAERSPLDTPLRNTVVCADNLDLMTTLPDGCCDLIYTDPPFNSNRIVISSSKPTMRYDDRHGADSADYLSFLRPRLAEMRRLLSGRGNLCVHLDWRSVHHVRIMLDEMFGAENFLNEIIWHYRSGGQATRWFARKHDTLLLYARKKGQHTFNTLRGGTYRTKDLKTSSDGRPYKSTRKGRIYFHPDGPITSDVWEIPFLSTVSKERTNYPSQKPEALVERLIRACSNQGDNVADFFCGSGTALVVAKQMKRDWIGCDSNPEAVAITNRRLEDVNFR